MSRPPVQTPVIKALKRTWGTEEFLIETEHYLGKRNTYKAGMSGGLQYHRKKEETFLIVIGTGTWEYDDGEGNLVEETVRAGDIRHIPPGAPHRFTAITDVVGYEWSTPHHDDRVRVEEEYGVEVKGKEYGLPTTLGPMEDRLDFGK